MMPTHQATAVPVLVPGVPSSSPRRVFTMGVIGWWSAKPRTQVAMFFTGTKALLGYATKAHQEPHAVGGFC